MVDNLIKGVLLGVFGYVWYWVAGSAPWLTDGAGNVGDGYMFFTIVAAALLASGK